MIGLLARLGARGIGPIAGLLLVAGLSMATCAPARAGWYDVVACSAVVGGAQNAFRAAADPGMAAYSVCPNTPSNPASGIVTRASATAGAGHVPMLAGAYQIFEAPPGAGLASVTFDLAAIRLSTNWTTGIVAWNQDFNSGFLPYGCYAGSAGCAIGSQSFFGPVTVGLGGHARFRFETRCGNPGGCDISASGFQPGMRALFAASNVVVTVHDFSAPAISPAHGALFGDGWHRGREEAWQSLGDNSGVMLLRLHADGRLVESQDYRDAAWPAHLRCDFTRSRPCNDVATAGLSLDTRTLSDGAHSIRIEAVDAGGNASHLDRTIQVDNTAPPPVSAQLDGDGGWRRHNEFAVRWDLPQLGGAPIAAVHYQLCPVGGAGGCSDGSRTGLPHDRLDGLRLPQTGEYKLRVWLEDAAGNSEPANAAPPIVLRYDGVAPEAVFTALDERDPLNVEARLSDEGSGVADGEIEIRRLGFRQWHELDTTVLPGRLRARVDDLQLPDGTYEARAIVRDHAGNERTTDRTESGGQMELKLPLRIASRIRVSTTRACKRSRKRERARRCRAPRAGQEIPAARPGGRIHGVLTTQAGQPVERATVAVYEQPRAGDGFRRTATLVSDSQGRFAHRASPGPSRVVRFQYEGTPLVKPATAQARVHVPARTTIKTSARRLRNGDTVVFSGRLTGRPLPEGGKLIDLQAHYRGSWRTFATPRSDDRGRWRFAYRFEATRGLVRYRFRARIRREAAYPYELGYSRVVSVIVSGPR